MLTDLFNTISGMFNHASEPDIEEDFNEEVCGDKLRVCYPEDFDPLYQGDFD